MSAVALADTLRKRLDDAIDAEATTINAGMLTFEDYKSRTGVRRGLLQARDILDQALRDYMKS